MWDLDSDMSSHPIPGQPARPVYGGKRIKNGYFKLTRYFLYTENPLRPSHGRITNSLRARLPITIYGSVMDTVYGPFYTVLIKFLFDNSVACSAYFFFFNIDFIYSYYSITYNDVNRLFTTMLMIYWIQESPYRLFIGRTGSYWQFHLKPSVNCIS